MEPTSFGRYQVQEKIGEGAIGRVYRAYDPEAQRAVAIKAIRSESLSPAARDEYLPHFQLEAQAASGLAHPHIAGVFDVGEDYLVMELVEGQTLEAVLKPGPLALTQALDLLRPLADAIDYAHQAGLVHRDIRPANIMVEPDGRPKLMDIGTAPLAAGAASTSGSVAAPAYMAPEQVQNGEVTHAADLFSFAVVAYETITGHRPFKGDTVATVVHRLVHEGPPSPRSWNRSLPRAYEGIFARALAKDPSRRFDSALSFVAALVDAASLQPETDADSTLITAAASSPDPARVEAAPPPATARPEKRPSGIDTLPPPPLRPRAQWLPWVVAGAALIALALGLLWPRLRPAPQAPSPPPSPAVASGEIQIEAEPAGASVWIDGVEAGTAPLTLKDLRLGAHQVRVLQDGYAPAELGFEIKEGLRPPALRFVMAPVGSPLTIASLPEGATVLVDGHAVEGPLERLVLTPGSHEVRLEAKGFVPQVERVAAEPGQRLAIEARLQPVPTPPPPRPRRAPSPPPTTVAAPAVAEAPPSPPPVTRGAMVSLDDTVTPPRRVSGEPAHYPEEARKLRLKGSVLVELTVSEDGQAEDIQILESAGAILDRAVLAAVERWRFAPAEKDGEQVRVRWKYKQTFLPSP